MQSFKAMSCSCSQKVYMISSLNKKTNESSMNWAIRLRWLRGRFDFCLIHVCMSACFCQRDMRWKDLYMRVCMILHICTEPWVHEQCVWLSLMRAGCGYRWGCCQAKAWRSVRNLPELNHDGTILFHNLHRIKLLSILILLGVLHMFCTFYILYGYIHLHEQYAFV